MSDVEPKRPGQIILGWWAQNIGDRNATRAEAMVARLRPRVQSRHGRLESADTL